MTKRRYRAVRKRDRKGNDAWGLAAFELQPGKPWQILFSEGSVQVGDRLRIVL